MISIFSLSLGGLIILFLWLFVGSFGLPAGTITMIAFGSLAGSINALILVIVISFVAVVLGDILAYELARKLSGRLREKLRKLSFFGDSEHRAKNLLDKYGFLIIFFSRFAILSLCVVVSYVSGFEKFNRRKFVTAVISGELLFAIIYPLIGFGIGVAFGNILTAVNYFILAILLLLLIFYLARLLLHRRKK